MPEPAASTQILETRIRPVGPAASRVELVIADAPDPEDAEATITISLEVNHGTRTVPFVVDLQNYALHDAVRLIREHTRILDEILENLRH